MSTFSGNRIVRNGLVLNLDPANIKNYTLSQVEVLVVAGGGSGGASVLSHGGSGGGGAGGLIYSPYYAVTANTPITATVGAGGAAVTPNLVNNGNVGANSVFGSITALGGGYGAHGYSGTNTPGGNGGSGGGGGYRGYTDVDNWGLGTSSQGNNGGGVSSVSASGGGGGGSGGAGNRNTGSGGGTGGLGGIGLPFVISGSVVTYATGGNGGTGVLSDGTTNSGNGGSGTYATSATYAGGSGIVIVRYNGPQKATGGTITKVGNDTVHTFTTSSVFTPFAAPTSGNTIIGLADLSLVSTNISTINSPTFDSANGGAVVLNGINQYINIPYTKTDLDGDPLFTVEAIVYRTDNIDNNGIWGISGGASRFGISSYSYPGQTNKISIDLWGTTTFNCGILYPLNQYIHIVWVKYAAQFGINSIYIYVNGVQYEASNFVVQRGSTTTPTLNTSTAGQGICIGKLCNSYNGYFAAAKIPVFRVYNRVLSAAEIAQNFDALRGRYGI